MTLVYILLFILFGIMVLPYRAKNPPERKPIVTISLIATNVVVYIFTTNHLAQVTPSALLALSYIHNLGSPLKMLTAMFLHATPEHIIGNMLFLWIFGASVEGRIGWWKFLILYLCSGFVGFMLEDVTIGFQNPDEPNLGASGAIMGVAGAYFYMFPYSVIRMWVKLLFWMRLVDWQARYVVLYFVGLDVLNQLFFQGKDGTAHFAHMGGFAFGIFAAMIINPRRDSEEASDAQAIRADMRDHRYLTLSELRSLVESGRVDPDLYVSYLRKLIAETNVKSDQECLATLQRHGTRLLAEADPAAMADVLLRIDVRDALRLPVIFFLRLGGRLESVMEMDLAARCYRRVWEISPDCPECETALYRLARLLQYNLNSPSDAAYFYTIVADKYPMGSFAQDARQAALKLGMPIQ